MSQLWFEVIHINGYIALIRERLDKVEPRYLTKYTNMFVIRGSHSAILFDTGSGVQSIKPIVDKIIENLDIIVINSHSHFDHVLSNYEFSEVYIHDLDASHIVNSHDVSLLPVNSEIYKSNNNTIPPCSKIVELKGDEIFDLGDLTVTVLHTPGHTPGSISLLTNKGDLFSGDTAHYGSVYLPSRDEIDTLINSLTNLRENQNILKVYPSHGNYGVGKEIFSETIEEIIDKYPLKLDIVVERPQSIGYYDKFLDAFVIKSDKFNLIYSK